MRVLLVTHRYPPDGLAGVEQYTQALAAELVRAGETVSIVTRRPGPSQELRIVRERLPHDASLYRFSGGKVRLDFPLTHAERLEQFFEAVMAEVDPEVVHFNQLMGLSPRFIEIARRLRVPIVISLHDFYFACPLIHLQKPTGEVCPGPDNGRNCGQTCFAHQRLHTTLGNPVLRWGLRTIYCRRLLMMAQRLVAGSEYVAEYFEKFVPGGVRIKVIPNGVRLEGRGRRPGACSTPRERGMLNLAYLGTVAPQKGAHRILEALRVADLGPIQLVILGAIPGPQQEYAQTLREQAATISGLKLCVYGEFQRAELPYLLDDVDCVIVPSLVPEAGPQVPREALAHGLPVIASRLGALPELVAEGKNGFTFDPTRPGELAAILRRLARDESLLSRLRQGVQNTPVVTVSGHAGAVRAVYREAADDLLRQRPACGADAPETRFLHEALMGLGFGADP
jgi:glycosyltransferase involved in cell wall biosynthesis